MRFIKNLSPAAAAATVALPMLAIVGLVLLGGPVFFAPFVVMPFLMIPFFILMWTVVGALSKQLPLDWKPRIRRFRFAVIYTAAYLCVFVVIATVFMHGGEGFLFELILPFHLVGMCTSIYSYYCVARATADATGRDVAWSNFFSLCMFQPYGVWVIHRQMRDALQVQS